MSFDVTKITAGELREKLKSLRDDEELTWVISEYGTTRGWIEGARIEVVEGGRHFVTSPKSNPTFQIVLSHPTPTHG